MPKYKKGDILVPNPYYKGFEKLTVERITDTHYYCKIMNGMADIPIHILESNYILIKE